MTNLRTEGRIIDAELRAFMLLMKHLFNSFYEKRTRIHEETFGMWRCLLSVFLEVRLCADAWTEGFAWLNAWLGEYWVTEGSPRLL